MKSIVIYYSQTGNTKQIAEAIYSGMSQSVNECDIVPLEKINAQNLVNYDLIGLGSPVIGFQEPDIVTDYIKKMPSMKGKYGFVFCTHGTCPGSYISRVVLALRRKGMVITGWNDWFGSLFIPIMIKPYYTDGHPDEIDLKEAKAFGREIVERSRKIASGRLRLIPRLPRKEKYDKLYGTPSFPQDPSDDFMKAREILFKLKPSVNMDKCRYPKCHICMDNCLTQSINLSKNLRISYQNCGPCMLWLCEQMCPTGAMEIDWELLKGYEDAIKSRFSKLAEPLKINKDIRRFRSLVPEKEEGRDGLLYRNKHHPRLIMHHGVASISK
jgi:flavodoxin/ferredoxin